MASHRPMQDHELSVSRHIPERETDVTPRTGEGQRLQYPKASTTEEPELSGGGGMLEREVDRTLPPVGEPTSQVKPQSPFREGTEVEDTVIPHPPTPERDQVHPLLLRNHERVN